MPLSYARSIPSTPPHLPHPIFEKSILISSHLSLGRPSVLFTSAFPPPRPCKHPATCPHPKHDQSTSRPPTSSHFLKIHLNILPSKPRSSRCSLYLAFPPTKTVYVPRHMPPILRKINPQHAPLPHPIS